MTNQHGSSRRKYTFLEHLSIENLELLLRLSSDSVEKEEFMDSVSEVIIQREREHPTGRIMNADDAWREFQSVYSATDRKSLSPGRSPSQDEINKTSARYYNSPARISLRRLGRSTVTFAATIVLVVTLMIGAQATGFDVFGTLARWTDSTFNHVTVPRDQDDTIRPQNTPNGSIDTERLLGKYAPTQLPKGATAVASTVQEDEFGMMIQVSFSLSDNRKFYIQLDQYRQNSYIDLQTFERDHTLEETYISHSRLFYILSNDGFYTATWSDSVTMITILGDLSVYELRTIIDSIGG